MTSEKEVKPIHELVRIANLYNHYWFTRNQADYDAALQEYEAFANKHGLILVLEEAVELGNLYQKVKKNRAAAVDSDGNSK